MKPSAVFDNNSFLYGKLNPQMVCPHCHEKGSVHTKQVKQKAGISGGKVTGACGILVFQARG